MRAEFQELGRFLAGSREALRRGEPDLEDEGDGEDGGDEGEGYVDGEEEGEDGNDDREEGIQGTPWFGEVEVVDGPAGAESNQRAISGAEAVLRRAAALEGRIGGFFPDQQLQQPAGRGGSRGGTERNAGE
jgi:hypothetical protein